MNKQASTAMWTAAALAASLLLGACGSDGGSKDKIDGAKGEGKAESKSPSPSKSSAGSGRQAPEEIKLAKDAKNVFEDAKTGDPKKDEVLADNQARINVVDRIITTGKSVNDLKLYADGQAFIDATKYIEEYTDDQYSWAGVTRYYNQQVKILDGSTAQVSYCVDDSKANDKNLKTGKLDPYESDDKRDTLETSRMRQSKSGIWQAYSSQTKRGAEECEK
ncbi:hypothetical protein ACQEU8_26940 [Streptomyces sp. CA-250714]|uniref:hypothetical protein n=1 Tax=Streptomyces sp. CA-250714 TaxID=3240060 RepID=UPI003D93B04D